MELPAFPALGRSSLEKKGPGTASVCWGAELKFNLSLPPIFPNAFAFPQCPAPNSKLCSLFNGCDCVWPERDRVEQQQFLSFVFDYVSYLFARRGCLELLRVQASGKIPRRAFRRPGNTSGAAGDLSWLSCVALSVCCSEPFRTGLSGMAVLLQKWKGSRWAGREQPAKVGSVKLEPGIT